MDELFREVSEMIRPYLSHLPADEQVPPDASLMDLGLSSVEAMGLLMDLEIKYGVSFADDQPVAEPLRTAQTLVAALQALRSRSP